MHARQIVRIPHALCVVRNVDLISTDPVRSGDGAEDHDGHNVAMHTLFRAA
jgi:hypothetical protein